MAEPFPAEGLPLEQARQAVLAALSASPMEEPLPLQQALGRLSAAPVLAAESVPGFRASILDGYAISTPEPPAPGTRWQLVGRSAPGVSYGAELGAGEVLTDDHIAKVSVVGVGMRSHSGVAATMFKALADVGVNIQMISTSEIKISVIIEEKYLELAVRSLHSAFGLDTVEIE